MNIDLDDRAWFDAIGVGEIGAHVVEGVPTCRRHGACDCRSYSGLPHCKMGCGHDTAVSGRLREWVALSEQKCETCKTFGDPDDYEDGWCMWVVETTDGDPTKIVQVHSEHGWRQVSYAPDWNSDPCPDCLGSGRLLVQVTVPCGCNCHEAASPDVQAECVWVKGCDSGRVSIGSVTVERKPLRIYDRIIPPVNVKPGEWLAWTGGHYLFQECDGVHLTTHPGRIVGPPPDTFDLDGVFGVIVRRVP